MVFEALSTHLLFWLGQANFKISTFFFFLSLDLHVMVNVSLDDPIMQEELFGPILPIVTVESVNEAIDVIKGRPKPLSMYIFTEKKDKMKQLIDVSTRHA